MSNDKNHKHKYSDFSNVEEARETILPEDLPEGAYGSPINKHEPVEGKSTPWEEGQHAASAFIYENKQLHRDHQRLDPESHPTHQDSGEN
ncbi:hypothetical protein AJ85_03240 [Alkalihalobacillus alcalophilus ATCC 27647 = CGMCC 1.3604]|uniref:Cytosolic protein n=1 Tax=Alkalihalobacillus alcalophilus ATCC 27647 = CGMCC 1.3604 TaxID=1218173 RepID=A0A094WI69_ALKAL|nr:hypothetical protein [Alkalihalobacillus alcalophilus]KGA95598.1 hypothetical protein BALCAV_0221580 [Alkalihalobacillus alcalophilus ATCC 27647 = CGMCC 1.3604]MED1564021.1 hypothetical protein [Alkalihalobacillus alcalophilus]THG91671.1 hypothetical protein AJ85_03240 [Alkalihalobacillus alcalophilus ATCC 27647 = CGMCC 1.3604]